MARVFNGKVEAEIRDDHPSGRNLRLAAPPYRLLACRSSRTYSWADFDRSICNKRKLAAWLAFWGEAKSRPTYQALSSSRDAYYQQVFIDLCTTLKESGGYTYDPQVVALALSAMLEGLWLRLMMGTEDTTRETALQATNAFLAAAFPKHYG